MTRKRADLGTGERSMPRATTEAMHDTRDAEVRDVPRTSSAEIEYRPPMNLDAPEPRPGMAQRWVRSSFRDGDDTLNYQARVGEGWRPRDPNSVPDHEARFRPLNNKADMITVGGLILMEIDEARLAAKRRWIHQESRKIEQSVSQDTDRASQVGVARGVDPIERKHETRVSTGRRPPTLDD